MKTRNSFKKVQYILMCLYLTCHGCLNPAFAQSGTFTDPRDEQEYRFIQIGDQIWMAENLRYLPQINAPREESDTIPYYYVYGCNGNSVEASKLTQNFKSYGVLYNWPAAMGGTFSAEVHTGWVQGACPPGWHLPGEEEWTKLLQYLSSTHGLKNHREQINGLGNQLKSCRQIDSPLGGDCNTTAHPRWASHEKHHGTDAFGFSGLPGGYRYAGGNIGNLGYHGYWWTATEDSPETAWRHDLNHSFGSLDAGICSKATGFSVRCIQNE